MRSIWPSRPVSLDVESGIAHAAGDVGRRSRRTPKRLVLDDAGDVKVRGCR